MTVPRIDVIPITVEILRDPNDWQLLKLENGFLAAIGEDLLSEEKKKRLQGAIEDSRIVFFIAKRGYRSVGMCSVSRYFSTYACTDTGVLEDFYIKPIFHKLGIAHQLIQAAQSWCKEHYIASLTACCAPCDESMYQSLGFDTFIGKTWAYLNDDTE